MVEGAISCYPAGPARVPAGLTRLSPLYGLRAALSILAIALFFALYFALIGTCTWLLYLSFRYGFGSKGEGFAILMIAARVIGFMLLAFSLKFLIKPRSRPPNNRVALERKDHPELFAFIDRICRETGAQRPRDVYVDPEINANVAYCESVAGGFLLGGKNLTIGLGLVDALTISEFKAVLAHEFGHFGQRSMRIGSFIAAANKIINDMIFTRDRWDESLETLRRAERGMAIVGIALSLIVDFIRAVLKAFYFTLNRLNASLSREMELNADKVAVGAAGSEAVVSSLWKLDYAAFCWNTTLEGLVHAAERGYWTDDFFFHLEKERQRLSPHVDAEIGKLPRDAEGRLRYFPAGPDLKDSGFGTHPGNARRESNAKNPFVTADVDPRSPWILFGKGSEYRKTLTDLLYRLYLGLEPATREPGLVQGVIEATRPEAFPTHEALNPQRVIGDRMV